MEDFSVSDRITALQDYKLFAANLMFDFEHSKIALFAVRSKQKEHGRPNLKAEVFGYITH
jgi:hypothetical protein